jgi:group II intron reverse transcriptase/maturase
LYQQTKTALGENRKPKFNNILDVCKTEVVILTAIHKLKSNKGSETAGSDGETMSNNILKKDFKKIIKQVQQTFTNYKAKEVRRVYIPKPGKDEKRPLGIPTIIDRIIQECVRMVIEPICEAHFFKHSYGFRPWRGAENALARINNVLHKSGNYWVIEGDISKFFDEVNHNKLIKILWDFGIRDKRILMIIQEMLKAGVMNEVQRNELGTPQGGIISPLLANVYLTPFDQFITREYEEKELQDKNLSDIQKYYIKTGRSGRRGKPRLKLKPAFLIRYADDWVIITDTKENAEKLVYRAKNYLENHLKLKLSLEKTQITNVRNKNITFLGYKIKMVRGKAKKGYITRTKPNEERLKDKVNELQKDIRMLKKSKDTETMISDINIINSKIRGLINYYEVTSFSSQILGKYNQKVRWCAYAAIRRRMGAKSTKAIKAKRTVDWVSAKDCTNLPNLHQDYKTALPAVRYNDHIIGVTDLAFVKFRIPNQFNQNETPFTKEGREFHLKRTEKKLRLSRHDLLFGSDALATKRLLAKTKSGSKYNFEYFLNRAYAYNRDKGKCRICKKDVLPNEIHTHHKKPSLPLDKVNKVAELVTTHSKCHIDLHNLTLCEEKLGHLGYNQTAVNQILKFRKEL